MRRSPRNAFIPYVQRGERHKAANTKTADRQNEMAPAQWHAQAAVTRHYTSYSIFWPRFSRVVLCAAAMSGPLKKFRRLLCQLPIKTATGRAVSADRSELKPGGVRGCENVNYHVWPEDK